MSLVIKGALQGVPRLTPKPLHSIFKVIKGLIWRSDVCTYIRTYAHTEYMQYTYSIQIYEHADKHEHTELITARK